MISALIIAKNEEKNIVACVENAKSFCDEVIVIDDNSSDNTAQLAKKHGAKVFKYVNPNFADKRNYGITKCKYEWICILDADERYDDALKKAIVNITYLKNNNKSQFLVRRKEFFLGRHYATTWQPRLFRKWTTKFIGVVHETFSSKESSMKIHQGYLYHYSNISYSNTIYKMNYYTDLEVEKIHKNKEGKLKIILKMFIYPPAVFFYQLFINRSIRAGIKGIIFALTSAFYFFVIYVKYYEKYYK